MVAEYCPKKDVTSTVETKIIITNNDPVRPPPRRLAPKEKEVLNKQIESWLKEGVIRPSKSEYSSQAIIVPKKTIGEYRVCMDYRQLNKRMKRDRFPMPLMEDCIDALTGAKVFSVIDLKNGFFHVPIAEESRKYTSFVTPNGQLEFVKTPFGLCNSPTSFLRWIQEVFADLIRRKVLITYMDDLIIPGIDNKDAYSKLGETLKVAEENGLNINWNKCAFLQRKVEFLGYVIEDGNVYPSPAKIKAVQKFPEPTSKLHVQSFLGLAGYFRKFIKDYAKIAYPLSDLLKGDHPFRFGVEQRRAFQALKDILSREPVLRIFDPNAVTELHTDASKEGYGAVIMPKKPEEKYFHPVHYMSRKTSDVEKNYNSHALEILAVIRALEKCRVYLLGLKFKLITDCQAFKNTLSKSTLPAKVAKWATALEEFDVETEHRAGEKMKHVDALSRFPVLIVEDKLITFIRRQQEEENG